MLLLGCIYILIILEYSSNHSLLWSYSTSVLMFSWTYSNIIFQCDNNIYCTCKMRLSSHLWNKLNVEGAPWWPNGSTAFDSSQQNVPHKNLQKIRNTFKKLCITSVSVFVCVDTVCWLVIMAPYSPMARQTVGRPSPSQEGPSATATEALFPAPSPTCFNASPRSAQIIQDIDFSGTIRQQTDFLHYLRCLKKNTSVKLTLCIW